MSEPIPDPGGKIRRTALGALLACGALYLLWAPVADLFLHGIFTWSVAQPATLQGGLEAVALFAATFLFLLAAERWRWAGLLAVLPLLFYLRRHAVDLAAAGTLLYVELLIALGAACWRLAAGGAPSPRRREGAPELSRYLAWLVAGISAWALLIVAASAIHRATPDALRALLLVVALASLAWTRHRAFLTVHLVRGALRGDRYTRAALAFVVSFTAALLARTNATPDYDSLWYGLRGDYVLAPDGSIFDRLGLIGGVFYYPKLFEALLLPVSGLGDFSLVIGFNIACLLLLGLAAHQLAERLGMGRRPALLASLLCITLPAAANIAAGAKPDVFAALLLAVATLFFWHFLTGGSTTDGLLALSAVGLSLVSKVTSLPYGGILVVSTAGAWAWKRHRSRRRESGTAATVAAPVPAPPAPLRFAALTFGLATLTGLAFTLRTYLLAGVPSLVPYGLWSWLGMSLRSPAGRIVRDRSKSIQDLPEIIHSFLFAPDSLPSVRVTWIGNAWFFFAAAALVLWLIQRRRRPLPTAAWSWSPVVAAGFFFALVYNNAKPGGDGNYYIYPVVLLMLLSLRALTQRAGWLLPLTLVLAAAFVGQQALISFVTCHWDPGTRTWDVDLTRTPFDTRQARQRELRQAGLDDVARYLEENPGVERVVAFGPATVINWLPAQVETLDVAAYFSPTPAKDPQELLRYLREQGIEFAVLPRVERREVGARVLEALAAEPQAVVVQDDLYRLVDLRPLTDRFPEILARLPEVEKVFWRLIPVLDQATLRGQGPLQGLGGQKIGVSGEAVRELTGRFGLLMVAGTEVEIEVRLPRRPSSFVSQVGLHPALIQRGGSDGAVAELTVTSADGQQRRRVDVDVQPGGGFLPVRMPMAGLEGQKVRVNLRVWNRRGRHQRHDWVLWVAPEILVAAPLASPSRGRERPPGQPPPATPSG